MITITKSTADVLFDDPLPHGAEYIVPFNGQSGELIIDGIEFQVVCDSSSEPKRLRARLVPQRWRR